MGEVSKPLGTFYSGAGKEREREKMEIFLAGVEIDSTWLPKPDGLAAELLNYEY